MQHRFGKHPAVASWATLDFQMDGLVKRELAVPSWIGGAMLVRRRQFEDERVYRKRDRLSTRRHSNHLRSNCILPLPALDQTRSGAGQENVHDIRDSWTSWATPETRDLDPRHDEKSLQRSARDDPCYVCFLSEYLDNWRVGARRTDGIRSMGSHVRPSTVWKMDLKHRRPLGFVFQ